MVPHDQQVEVAWPGTIKLDLDSELAINTFTTNAEPCVARYACRVREGDAVV
jgi:hypothetical protein